MNDIIDMVTVNYKTAAGFEICVEVTPQVAELLEQSAKQIRSQRRQAIPELCRIHRQFCRHD